MSFIDLMASDVWSEADIKSRLHQEIRSEISEFSETELNRALQGKFMGLHTLTAAEGALLTKFAAATARVADLGAQARADMALLHQVLALEPEQARLALPVLEPVTALVGKVKTVTNQEALDLDLAERAAAQAVVDAASPEALALSLLRNPVPEPVVDPALVVDPVPV